MALPFLFCSLLSLLVSCTRNEEKLFEAIEKGDTVKVKALLARGVDVNSKNKEGLTPLMLASWTKKQQ